MVHVKKFATRLSPEFLNRLSKTKVPWGPLGYVTFKRTYARLREDLGRTEEWIDVVGRNLNAFLDYGMRMTQAEVEDFAEAFYTLKCLPAGRMLWQAGSPTVARLGGPSLQNCHFVKIDRPSAFAFVFDMLMLGGGVGFSVLPSDVHKLPVVKGPINLVRVDGSDVDFIVPDNREGWVELLRKLLDSYFVTGRNFSYSTHCIRGRGTRIKSFGGVASGPEELIRGIGQICSVLNDRSGKHVRPIDALDVMNIIGSVVVAGNVRRSAQVSIGHVEDKDYIFAKNWGSGNIPNWRAMSNNSIATSDIRKLPDYFWDGYDGSGEPYGLLNLDLMRSHGRLIDGPDKYRDMSICGANPCVEQGLADEEACCLSELVPFNIPTTAKFIKYAGYLYKVCKTCLQLPFNWPGAAKIVKQNQRMGISMTGLCTPHRFTNKEFDSCYKATRALDKTYSKEIKANTSVRMFTQKPSGTLGLLPGGDESGDQWILPAGLHPGYSEWMYRRVRFAAADPLVEACRKAGYPVEPQLQFDGTPNWDTMVVTFPAQSKPGTILARGITAVDQLKMAKGIQTYWSDNNVSQTVYYKKDELPYIKEWLKDNYKTSVKAVSFLLHSEHGFKQAPYEEVTREQYTELKSKVKPITYLEEQTQWEMVDSLECAGGVCPVK